MISLKKLFWINSYFGSQRKSWNNNMSIFVLGYKSNMYVINLNYTLFLFYKSLRIFKIFVKKRKRIMFYVPFFVMQYKNFFKKLYHKVSLKLILVVSSWIFGFFTNVRILNKKYTHFFKNGFPAGLVILNNFKYEYVINESFIMSIPSFCFVDTSQDPFLSDFVIPANTGDSESLLFYMKIILAYMQIMVYKEHYFFFKNILSLLLKKLNKNNYE